MRTPPIYKILALAVVITTNLLVAALHAETVLTKDYAAVSLRPLPWGVAGQRAQTFLPQASGPISPALLGYGEHNTFFLGGLYGPHLSGLFADGVLFGPYGGLSFSIEHFEAADQTTALRFGYGSFLTKHVATGVTITPRFTQFKNQNAFGLGLDPMLLFDSKWFFSFDGSDGWGIYSPSVYFQTANLEIPVGESALLASPSAHLGFTTGVYQSSVWNLALLASTYGTERFDTLPLLVGLQAQYSWAYFSLGYGAFNFSKRADGVRLGVGMSLPINENKLFAFYGLGLSSAGETELHSLSLGMRLGGIDNDAPEVLVESDAVAFSPNNDGVRDSMVFQVNVRDKSAITFYELRILDAQGSEVFKDRADGRVREKDFRWSTFFRSFFSPMGRTDVPEKFVWNGRVQEEKKLAVKDAIFEREAKDRALPDGAYVWQFKAIDEKNNESRVASGEVQIDTVPPKAKVEIESDMLSPNGDGAHDVLTIVQEVNADDSYEGTVLNAEQKIVRTWRWQKNAPTRLDFDGLQDNGELAAEGVYQYEIKGSDAAGNSAQAKSGAFYISRRQDSVLLKSTALELNPTQKQHATLAFEPSLAFSEGYQGGEITIRKGCSTKVEDTVFQISVLENPAMNMKKKEKVKYTWDGKNSAGELVTDGVYCAVFTARYQSGNSPESPALRILLDTEPPRLSVRADLTVREFTPDRDGQGDTQVFRTEVVDASPIAAYSLQIFEVAVDEKKTTRIPIRAFAGTGAAPEAILWDGKTENGDTIDSLTQFEFVLSVSDTLGNTASTTPQRFETGVFAESLAASLRIRVPYIDTQQPITDRMDLVYALVSKYPKYKVFVEVHTSLGRGVERKLKESEVAARQIAEFLIEKGIDAKQVTYQGFGASKPLFSSKSKFVPKNQRLDIFLTD